MILNYCNFWHKQFGEVVNGAARLLAAGRLETPLRKQLLGVGAPHQHTLPCHSFSHTNLESPFVEQR